MNIIIIKNNLHEELKKYNYVLGSTLLIIYLKKIKNKYIYDVKTSELLEEFIYFLSSSQNELENVKNGFNILCNIKNINILIELLSFFNPSNYYRI
jgi:hypothetical protein